MSSINAAYTTIDAISLLYIKKHGGQFTMIFFVKSLVQPAVTAFSGFLVVNSYPNYLYVFCLSDVFYVICLLMTIFWLDFDKVKHNRSTATLSFIKTAREMMNPAVANFLATVLCFGVLNGVIERSRTDNRKFSAGSLQ